MNTSPSNIFYILLLLERYRQNYQAVLAATGMSGGDECVSCILL